MVLSFIVQCDLRPQQFAAYEMRYTQLTSELTAVHSQQNQCLAQNHQDCIKKIEEDEPLRPEVIPVLIENELMIA